MSALADPDLDAPAVPGPDLQSPLAAADPEVAAAIAAELRRQRSTRGRVAALVERRPLHPDLGADS
ncbi:hypothetical protein [Pseudonocardia lacus]|uniref:hypothetical protein n=1 Tax=Pseudonocardia lacus TaxID=2835865 RepID=UPI001BDD2867|nr:hypothetical protein [Pseudonocardia lacus]